MKINELLGDMLEFMSGSAQSPSATNYKELSFPNKPQVQEQTPETEDQAEQNTMVPPLQQKIELLKKAVDVDSFYDDEDDEY